MAKKASFSDVLQGAAHVVADGQILRAEVPSYWLDDPEARNETVVTGYPQAGMPDHQEVFAFPPTWNGRKLAAALRKHGYSRIRPHWDD
jgi:hypothetical protein